MTTQIQANLIVDEPADVYHARAGECLSSHLLAIFRNCPLLYHWRVSGKTHDEDRPAYLIGRALHTLALEGREKYDTEYTVGGPINPRTGRPFGPDSDAFRSWAAAQGKSVLTVDQAQLVEQMAAGVQAHRLACELLCDGVAEAVARCEYRGVLSQSRFDWLRLGQGVSLGIVDLKTCDDLTWFEADSRRFGYAHQLAFYRSVLAASAGLNVLDVPVHLIGIEKQPPFRCGVWRIGEDVLAHAQKENEDAIERLKRCRQSGIWPTGYEAPRTFDWV